ncbi:hypothetical protein CTAYLR_001365 [Chrysophaeum taylorii]|uniref:Uncharacterized protein n=1 Tax=Chrysophaeum taylorii TaxID=2483200 RepID=A0AAD7U7C4_9STRA|nr:hypothetical protein CTAYLR_001365 [Chrysophaeum taylorii]
MDEAKGDPRRWEHLGMLVSLTVCSHMGWVMYATVPSRTGDALDVSQTAVTLTATVYPALSLVGSWVASRALGRGGLRGALVETCWLMVIGGLLRCAGAAVGGRVGFAIVLCGQTLCGLGQPHVVNNPVTLGNEWFPVAERETASTVGLLGDILGQAIGEALAPIVVERSGIFALSVAYLAPVVATAVWVYARFENRLPPRGPTDLFSAWRRALDDVEFRILALTFWLGLSVFNTVLSLASQWLHRCGYSATEVGFFAATFVLAGAPASLFAALSLDSTRAYRPLLKGLGLFDMVATLVLAGATRPRNALLLFLSFGLLGASLVATAFTLIETAVECLHPTPPEISTSLLFVGGNLLSIPVTYVFLALLRADRCHPADHFLRHPLSGTPPPPTTTFIICVFACCLALLLLYRGPYRRLEAETQQRVV